jgi:hypothetical protein
VPEDDSDGDGEDAVEGELMILDVTLPIELHNRNTGRGGAHWQTTNERKDIEATLRMLGHARTPFEFPVGLTIVRLLAKRQRFLDTDSVGRGNAKELIDSLVVCGWFADDKPEHIRTVHYMQDERGKKLRTHGETRIIVWRMDGLEGSLSPTACEPLPPQASLITGD